MNENDATLWTIDALSARVAEALSAGYTGVRSGRVRDVPDSRTIRYYTTLGLLDRPAVMRGRTALYGSRHLLQVVAIKRLQTEGLSLAAVQERLLGLSNAALRRLARLETAVHPVRVPRSPTRVNSLWRAPDQALCDAERPPIALGPAAFAPAEEEGAQGSGVETVSLGNGVTLSLATPRALGADDLRVMRLAAAPLVELLKLRGLLPIE
jgi:hypothetical protein